MTMKSNEADLRIFDAMEQDAVTHLRTGKYFRFANDAIASKLLLRVRLEFPRAILIRAGIRQYILLPALLSALVTTLKHEKQCLEAARIVLTEEASRVNNALRDIEEFTREKDPNAQALSVKLICQKEQFAAGGAFARTCPTCGLTGDCLFPKWKDTEIK